MKKSIYILLLVVLITVLGCSPYGTPAKRLGVVSEIRGIKEGVCYATIKFKDAKSRTFYTTVVFEVPCKWTPGTVVELRVVE